MQQKNSALSFFLLLLACGQPLLASKGYSDNHIHFHFHGTYDANCQKYTPNLSAVEPINLKSKEYPGTDWIVPSTGCPASGDVIMGIVSEDYAMPFESVDGADYPDFKTYTSSKGTFYEDDYYSCPRGNSVRQDTQVPDNYYSVTIGHDYPNDHFGFAVQGRHDTKTVANYFAALLDQNSSLIIVSNGDAFKRGCEDETAVYIQENGFPKYANFAFAVNITFELAEDTVVCKNMVFAQEGTNTYRTRNAAPSGPQLAEEGVSELTGLSTYEPLWDSAKENYIIQKAKKRAQEFADETEKLTVAANAIEELTAQKNIWWMGQVATEEAGHEMWAMPYDQSPFQGVLPEYDWVHTYYCPVKDDPSRFYYMVVTQDDDSSDTFNVTFRKSYDELAPGQDTCHQ